MRLARRVYKKSKRTVVLGIHCRKCLKRRGFRNEGQGGEKTETQRKKSN